MDELMNLLSQLGLGSAAHRIYDMIMDLDPGSMSAAQLEQQICKILAVHGAEACAEPVIAALAEVNFAGLRQPGHASPQHGADARREDPDHKNTRAGRAR